MLTTSQPLTENLTQADFEAMWAESWEELGVVDPNIVVEQASPPQEEPFTGLYHTHFRDYDHRTGRWLSEDPKGEAGAGGPNLYAYCLNDPLNLIDKSGGEVSVEEYENLLVMGANLGSALKRSEAAGKDNNPVGAYLNLMLADYIYGMMKSNLKESWASVESGPSLNRLAHESLGGAILDVIPRKFYGPVDATKRAMLRAQGIPANHHTLAGLPMNTISSHSTQMLPIELYGLGGKAAVSALRRAFMRMLTSQAGKSVATAAGGFAVTKISGSFFRELGSRLNPFNYSPAGFYSGMPIPQYTGAKLSKLTADDFVFRGTTVGYENARAGVTFTSTEPLVGTVFAVQKQNLGEAVLEIVPRSSLKGIEVLPSVSSTLQRIEAELIFNLSQSSFSKLSTQIPLSKVRSTLVDMGVSVPRNVPLGDLSSVLKSLPKLNSAQKTELLRRLGVIK